MIRTLVSRLPPSLVRGIGRLQFKFPWLQPLIVRMAQRMAAAEGVIAHGVGKGLRFNATGGYAGYLLGTSEIDEQNLLARLLQPGHVFYDIGANIGFYATLAGRLVGDGGRVYAFEPFPRSAALCRANALRNDFRNIQVVEAAVGAVTKNASLAVSASSATHRLQDQGNTQPVQVVSIDEWRKATGAPGPHLIMIDIEGAEIEALNGMRATLREFRPALMIEVHWLGKSFADYCQTELAPLGYQWTTYLGEELPSQVTRYHALLVSREVQF